MALFETIVSLLFISALLLHLSRWVKAPYPTMLALAGAAVAAFSWAPRVTMDPQLAMALFVAPAILDSAYDTSPRELKRNWLPLIALAVFAVVLTSAAVAWLGWGYAGLPLAAAIALGAIVAPPDAAAATAVLGNLGIPRRTMSILQGESLLNDAVALLIFGAALAFSQGGADPWTLTPRLLWAAPGGVLLGLAAGFVWTRLWHAWAGTLTSTILEFAITFGLWIVAERFGISPVLTIVAYAMLIARQGPERQRPRDRLHSASVWDAAVFTLNVLAFLLMGLQARAILHRLHGAALTEALTFAGLVFLVVVLVRVLWVMIYRNLSRPLANRLHDPTGPYSNSRLRLLVAWCGMRGILTLATALSLPLHFPGRDVIVLAAFGVVLGTLIIQGGTIGLVIRWLGIAQDQSLNEELASARRQLAQAALAELKSRDDAPTAQRTALLEFFEDRASSVAPSAMQNGTIAMELATIQAERNALIAMRRHGQIAEDTFRVLQQELDWRELSIAPLDARAIAEA